MFPNWNNKNQTPAAPAPAAAAAATPTPAPTYSYGYAHHQQQAFTTPVVTPEQQVAIQQWQAYQQQYAQWHAMYGEAYQRELAAQQAAAAAVAAVAVPVQPPLPYGNPAPPPPPADPPKPPEPPAEGGGVDVKPQAAPQPAPQPVPQHVRSLPFNLGQPPPPPPPEESRNNNRFGNQAKDGGQANWNRGNLQNRGSNNNIGNYQVPPPNIPQFQPQNQPPNLPPNLPQFQPQNQPPNQPQFQPQNQPPNQQLIPPQFQPQNQRQIPPQIQPQNKPQTSIPSLMDLGNLGSMGNFGPSDRGRNRGGRGGNNSGNNRGGRNNSFDDNRSNTSFEENRNNRGSNNFEDNRNNRGNNNFDDNRNNRGNNNFDDSRNNRGTNNFDDNRSNKSFDDNRSNRSNNNFEDNRNNRGNNNFDDNRSNKSFDNNRGNNNSFGDNRNNQDMNASFEDNRNNRGNNNFDDNRSNNSFDDNRSNRGNNRGNRGRNNGNNNWRGNDRWNNNNGSNNSNNRPNVNPWQNNDQDDSGGRANFRNDNRWNDDGGDGYRDTQDPKWGQGDSQDRQDQQEPAPPIDPDAKTPEELAFDLQFQKWQSDFDAWKKANVNHPDRVAYREYEMKFEECRVKLVERREQMKRKKLEALAKVQPPAAEPLKPPPPVPLPVEEEPPIAEPVVEAAPPKQWSYTNSFFNSSTGSSGGIPGLDFAEGGEAAGGKEKEEEKKVESNVPVIELDIDERPAPKEVAKTSESAAVPEMNDFSKNVNSLLGNQQLLSLLSSINKPGAVQATVAAVAPLLSALGQSTPGELQKQAPPPSLLGQQKLPNLNNQQTPPIFNNQQMPPSFNNQQMPPSVSNQQMPPNFNNQQMPPNISNRPPSFNQQMPPNFNNQQMPPNFNQQPPPSQFDDFGNNRKRPAGNFNLNRSAFDFGDDNANVGNFGDFDDRGSRVFGGGRGFQNRNFDDSRSQHSNQSFGNQRFGQFGAQNFDDRSQHSAQGFTNDYNDDYEDEEDYDASRFQEDEYQEEAPPPEHGQFQRNSNFGGPAFDRDDMEMGGSNSQISNSQISNFNQPDRMAKPSVPRFDSVMEEFEYYRNLEKNKTVGEMGGGSQDGFNRKRDYTGAPKQNDEDFYRPATVIDYQNRPSNLGAKSMFEDILLPTKVVDYGHKKPVASKLLSGFLGTPEVVAKTDEEQMGEDDSEELQSMQTIDYGHMRPFFQKSLKRKKNAKKRLKRYQRVAPHLIVESNASYPCKWQLVNDTRDMTAIRTKRGRRKRRNGQLYVKKRLGAQPKPPVTDSMKIDGDDISDTEMADDMDTPAGKVPLSFMADEEALDTISSDSGSDMDLESDKDDGKLYVKVGNLLLLPHRMQRPKKILIVMRGPPGSGKSHLAKLIKDKECEMGGSMPRILCLDDYFMVETEEIRKCPDTGRRVVEKKMTYEYEEEMESNYMKFLMKSFKKTVCDGLHPFIIVDCVNESLECYNEFCTFGTANGFRVYTCDLPVDINTCIKHNIHKRDTSKIAKMIKDWAPTPDSSILLDCKVLYKKDKTKAAKEKAASQGQETGKNTQASDVSDEEFAENEDSQNNDDDDDASKSGFFSSKWDADTSEQNLARLDGISKPLRPATTIEDYLQLDGWEPSQQPSKPGQKRVRWADIEEKRQQQKMRAIGFVVGSTNWDRMLDTTDGASALVKTKYIERVRKN